MTASLSEMAERRTIVPEIRYAPFPGIHIGVWAVCYTCRITFYNNLEPDSESIARAAAEFRTHCTGCSSSGAIISYGTDNFGNLMTKNGQNGHNSHS